MPEKPTTPLPFLQNGVYQVAILVSDLMEAIEHYYEDWGVGPWKIFTYGKPLCTGTTYYGKEADYQMRVGLSMAGPMRIELIQPLSGESIYADFIAAHGYGVHHFGLLVDDMPSAMAEAQAAGYKVIQDGSGFGLEGDGHYAYLDTEDTLHVTLELIEQPEKRHEPEAIYPPEA